MKAITLGVEHGLLLFGLLFMLMGILWFSFFIIGVTGVVCSYAVDLVKRMKETDLGDVPDILKK